MVVDFGYIYYGCQIKNVSTCVKEKFKFVANYDKWLKQSRNFHYEARKTKIFQCFANAPYQGCASGHYEETHRFPSSLIMHERKWRPSSVVFIVEQIE